MVRVDLKDAYFTIHIHQDHQKYLRFKVDGTGYQFTCLPFGLSCMPWTFTKVMMLLITLLRSWDIRIIIYIDNMSILSDSKMEAVQHLEVISINLNSNTSPRNRIFRTDGRLSEHPAQAPRPETATDLQGSRPHFNVPGRISTSTLPVHRPKDTTNYLWQWLSLISQLPHVLCPLVTRDTVTLMGIDVSIFAGHSTRGASTVCG